MKYHDNIIVINYKNLSLFTLNLLRKNLLLLFLIDEKCSIVPISSGRQFHRSTIRLKKENLKTSVLKRPFTSQCRFTISDVIFGCLKIYT